MTFNILLVASALLFAAPNMPEYKIGDTIKNFSLINTGDNKAISLVDFTDRKAIVIVFTSHSCPYSKIYDQRLITLAKQYDQAQVKFMFINSQTVSNEDQPVKMASWSSANGLTYLTDPRKEVARQFSATRTPEAFVLKNLNGKFILQYKGAIDDNPQAANQVNVEYLKTAITSVLSNEAVKVPEKRATGCVLK